MASNEPLLQVTEITKRYGEVVAVDGLSFCAGIGELITLLGPSGCGKTTTLRMLAGFIRPDSGEIRVDGKIFSSPAYAEPPERRRMGMVFQDYAIWPHMNVFENVAFTLRIRKLPRAEIRRRVGEALDLVHLSGLESRYASEISGGQQQRIALARAIASDPKIMLLDEPLSNLDAKLREQMRIEIKELQNQIRITFIYVTHDQVEALAISDRIILVNNGRVEQEGTPHEIYHEPANSFVADFVGTANLFEGRLVQGSDRNGFARFDLDGGVHLLGRVSGRPLASALHGLFIRPEGIQLYRSPPADAKNILRGTIRHRIMLGNIIHYHVVTGTQTVLVQVHPFTEEASIEAGDEIYAWFNPDACLIIPRQT